MENYTGLLCAASARTQDPNLLCAYSHKHVQAYSNCVAIRVTTPYRVVLAGVCAALRRRSVRGVWEV